jgi:hypothetical protein
MALFGLRLNQIDDRLSLGQIEATIEEGTFGEFPRLRQSRPTGDERLEDAGHDADAPMAADLDDVFARVRVRRPHVGHQHLIEFGTGAGVHDTAEAHPVRGQAFHRPAASIPEHRPHNRNGVRPADADDAQASCANGRSDGGNRVVRRRLHLSSSSAQSATVKPSYQRTA